MKRRILTSLLISYVIVIPFALKPTAHDDEYLTIDPSSLLELHPV